MEIDDPKNFFRPPNDNAYETHERRKGPPLDYVAEKFRHTIEGLHEVCRCLQSEAAAATGDGAFYFTPGTEKRYFAARHAFQSAIVGYLALKNMLALTSDNDLDNRLLTYSPEEFKEWLGRIDKEGSVTG